MIKKIALLTCYNMYDTKRYFTKKIQEAFQSFNLEASIFSWEHGPLPEYTLQEVNKFEPDITFSFHQLPKQDDGRYFWDAAKRPHWTYLLDPVFYDLELMESPYSLISCMDQNDCELLASYHFTNGFFAPHAIERELCEQNDTLEKNFDVVFFGSCYDPDHLRAYWKDKYPKFISEAIDEAIEIFFSNQELTFLQATIQALALNEIDKKEIEFDQLVYYVDQYIRGIDRVQLIKSIKQAKVHVFGGKCWREEKPIMDWSYYLASQSNVKIYSPIHYENAIEILKRSKICLNSSPTFRKGAHERVFASFACGALPITNQNYFLKNNFNNFDIFYNILDLKELNEKVNYHLSNEQVRMEKVVEGRKLVKNHHTWHNRVDNFLNSKIIDL